MYQYCKANIASVITMIMTEFTLLELFFVGHRDLKCFIIFLELPWGKTWQWRKNVFVSQLWNFNLSFINYRCGVSHVLPIYIQVSIFLKRFLDWLLIQKGENVWCPVVDRYLVQCAVLPCAKCFQNRATVDLNWYSATGNKSMFPIFIHFFNLFLPPQGIQKLMFGKWNSKLLHRT